MAENSFQPRSDLHIHSGHSHDVTNGTTLASIRDESRAAGIRQIGITEHLNNRKTDAHVRASRARSEALGVPAKRPGEVRGVAPSS